MGIIIYVYIQSLNGELRGFYSNHMNFTHDLSQTYMTLSLVFVASSVEKCDTQSRRYHQEWK